MTTSSVALMRHMQWWVLRMASEEITRGGTGLPAPPPLAAADARAVSAWLRHCGDLVAPGGLR